MNRKNKANAKFPVAFQIKNGKTKPSFQIMLKIGARQWCSNKTYHSVKNLTWESFQFKFRDLAKYARYAFAHNPGLVEGWEWIMASGSVGMLSVSVCGFSHS